MRDRGGPARFRRPHARSTCARSGDARMAEGTAAKATRSRAATRPPFAYLGSSTRGGGSGPVGHPDRVCCRRAIRPAPLLPHSLCQRCRGVWPRAPVASRGGTRPRQRPRSDIAAGRDAFGSSAAGRSAGQTRGVADWRDEADRWWAEVLGVPAAAMRAGGVFPGSRFDHVGIVAVAGAAGPGSVRTGRYRAGLARHAGADRQYGCPRG